jgi:hypothetical protein
MAGRSSAVDRRRRAEERVSGGAGDRRELLGIALSDLWRSDGTIDRGPYVILGIVAFAVKHNLDRIVATVVFQKRWDFFNYIVPPAEGGSLFSLPRADRELYATLLVLALPFIWMGVALTLRQLRSPGSLSASSRFSSYPS